MTIDELRRAMHSLPGDAKVFITSEDDERGPQLLTWDKTSRILRLCWEDHGVTAPERVLEDYSGASSQFGVGA